MALLRIYILGWIVLLALSRCSTRSESSSLSSVSGLSFSPAGGPVTGGNTLILTGMTFPPGASVQVGGADCSVVALGANSLTCKVPAGALGWVPVVLTLKGQGTTTLPTKYVYGAAVVGQPGSLSNSLSYLNSLTQPESAFVAGTSLFVADGQANRVAIFSPLPTASGAAPTAVLGQTDLFGGQVAYSGANPYALTVGTPRAFCSDGTRFYAVDSGRHRVLVYAQTPAGSSAVPIFVLGQTDFVGQQPNQGAATVDGTKLFSPQAVYCGGGLLIVADTSNHRVLIWNQAITANAQAANLVLGQPDLVSNSANQGVAVSAVTMNAPRGVLLSGANLYVSDSGNQRVLVWTTAVTTNDQAASLSLGPSSLTSASGGGCTQPGLSGPSGIAQAGNFLYVADTTLNRVLGWDITGGIGTVSGINATIVLGQANFTSCNPNQGTTTPTTGTLRAPVGLFSAVVGSSNNLYIADTGNNRILLYNTAPTTMTAAADLYFGQNSAAGVNPAAALVNPTSLRSPQSAAVFGNSLYVADNVLNRVLVYTPVPTTNGAPATQVLGQPDLTTAVSNLISGAVSAQTLSGPKTVYTDVAQNLYVADAGNSRVLMFTGLPAGNDPSATLALGQAGLTTGSGATTSTGARSPAAVCIANGQLFVADAGNNRILVYDAWNPAGGSGQAATYVIGQADMVSKGANQGTPFLPSATSLSNPSALACDLNHLIVADLGNQRVLVYNLPVAANTPAATLVLGQPDFVSYLPNRGSVTPSGASFYNPRGVALDGAKLFVADAHNHRVLIWNSFPTTNGQPATAVFGQMSLSGFLPNQGSSTPTLITLNAPAGVSISAGRMVISDSGNARVVLVPEPTP